MKALTQRALTGGLAVLLSACASYPHQTYYPATGAYTHYEGYSVIQQSYYGGYPVRYHSLPPGIIILTILITGPTLNIPIIVAMRGL
ncbi:MAG: hypothetical protein ACU83O_00285 [Gammaproteobacteria bacterium]